MANYYATTVSEGGKIAKKDIKKVEEIMAKYMFMGGDGDLTVEINGDELAIYGDCSASAYYPSKEDPTEADYDEEVMDVFLEEIAPFLKTPLVVKEVGNEKCRYVCAWAYVVRPNKKVVSVSLDEAVAKIINRK